MRIEAQHSTSSSSSTSQIDPRLRPSKSKLQRTRSTLYFLYQVTPFLPLLIFLCNCSMPYNSASAVGGQPGTYRSTGTMRSHPRTTEYE